MNLKLYNTASKKLEDFKPIHKEEVLMYSCGPTVYNYPHIGNWASYIYWDILVRTLKANEFNVKRVVNITDVGHLVSNADEGEDKLEKGAKREGKTAQQIADFYTKDFIDGMKKLNLLEPRYLAKATDFVPAQLELVQILKDKGYTYQTKDGIYFDSSKFKDYAKFAKLDLENIKEGARVAANPEKKHPYDFALWKFTPDGETRDMQWDTPVELLDKPEEHKPGFPGWHVECSAIILSLLGETIDIHTGGIDHIPVHHTNEIAQSQAATGKKFCNFWIHNDFMTIDGQKISKSLDNCITLDDMAKKGFSPLDFKLFILQGHYQNQGNFSYESLNSAKNRLQNWRNVACIRHQIHKTLKSSQDKSLIIPSYSSRQAILEALNNNLATPEALRIIDEELSKVSSSPLDELGHDSLVQLIETIDELLGLDLMKSTPDITDEAKMLILERKQARQQSDWKTADKIRHKLDKIGISIRDSDDNTIWYYKDYI